MSNKAKDLLGKAAHIDERIKNKMKQIDAIHELIPSGYHLPIDMPRSPNKKVDGIEQTAIMLADEKAKLEMQLVKLVRLRADVYAAIESVNDAVLVTILQKRYIEDLSWMDIADDMNYSQSSVLRLHREALSAIVLPDEAN